MDYKRLEQVQEWEKANRPLTTLEKHRLFKLSLDDLEDELHRMAHEE